MNGEIYLDVDAYSILYFIQFYNIFLTIQKQNLMSFVYSKKIFLLIGNVCLRDNILFRLCAI